MRGEPATIDLGVYGYEAGPERTPEPDRPWRVRQWFAGLRPWLLAVLVAALVAPLGGAAPARSGLSLVWTVPDSSGTSSMRYLIAETDLYVLARGDGYRVTLAAYRLGDGALRWRVPLAYLDGADFAALRLTSAGELPMVVDAAPAVSISVHDPATGQLRWAGDGSIHLRRDDLVALYHRRYKPGVLPPTPVTRLTVRRIGSGTLVASVADVAAGVLDFWRDSHGAVHLLTVRAGELIRVDLATGGVVASAPSPYRESPYPESDDGLAQLQVIDGLVLLGGIEGVIAYDAATLERRWRVPHGFSALPCGAVICVGSISVPEAAEPRLEAVDPATGERRWSVGCPVDQLANCYLSVDALGSGDRLLMQAHPLDRRPWEPAGYAWIAAADTGGRLTEPVEWLVPDPADANGGLLTREISPVDRDDPPSLDREPSQHWWARSGPDLAGIEIIGVVEADECQPRDPYLVCHTQGEPIEVWRIR